MAVSLATPDNIPTRQRRLDGKVKAELAFRFSSLHGKVYCEDILDHAHDLMRLNKGALGVDGVTFEMIEAAGFDAWLSDIRMDLIEKT